RAGTRRKDGTAFLSTAGTERERQAASVDAERRQIVVEEAVETRLAVHDQHTEAGVVAVAAGQHRAALDPHGGIAVVAVQQQQVAHRRAGLHADAGAAVVAALVEARRAAALRDLRCRERAARQLPETDIGTADPAALAARVDTAPAPGAAIDAEAGFARQLADDVVGAPRALVQGVRL